ncbi:MAG: purine-nucleoside phosphorylase [Gemmatimonadaceae bacterium]|nr:purine-nucleoside phosphorylase [Gemmatimonadaceae bacterium]MCW5825695.1 purine-nucleoside phosphorylase [Gemmatimonadaceae bacterium]
MSAAAQDHGATAARAAADAVRARLGVTSPAAAIVLGSGLGGLAERVANARRVPYAEIPGFHAPGVEGHRGELIAGTLGGREVLLLAGRFHMYEGHSAQVAAFPVRVVHGLGAQVLFVSNAAGGINRAFPPGTLMMIVDHLNLQFRNPLEGRVEPGDIRFPDMSAPYAPRLQALLDAAAAEVGLTLARGVYAGLLGPTYETPAEVRMLATLGADAVGMSTVPETIVARAIGMEVAGVSCITNPAAGISETPLNHAEVMDEGRKAGAAFCGLVERWVAKL